MFTDPSTRSCVNLSETPVDYLCNDNPSADAHDGLILHRIWMGLAIYGVDERGTRLTGTAPINEGPTHVINGPLKGQKGVS